MYRIKVKRYLLKTSITLQRKIFGIWVYWDGYNVKSSTPSFHESEAMIIANSLMKIKEIPVERLLVY